MRTCNNCKYSNGWHDPDPCKTCRFLADDRNNWEPAEDEVELVNITRCKDCVKNDAKYGNEENWCLKFGYVMHDDDFCSYGEKEAE